MRKLLRPCLAAAVMLGVVMLPTASMAANAFPPDPTCQANGVVRAILYQGGVAYLGGDFTQVAPAGATIGGAGTVTRNHLAACSQSTGAVLSWNPGADGQVFTLVGDGSAIYVGGKFATLAGVARKNLGELTAAGAATTWNPGASDTVYVLRFGPDGNLYAGGLFANIGGAARHRIAELSPTTGTPTAWNVNVGQVTGFACPPRCPPVVYTIGFTGTASSGTVYFGGQFGLVNGTSRNTAAAVSAQTGGLTGWDPNIYAAANCPVCPTVETSRVYTLITDPASGRVYTCGGYWKVNGTKQSFNVSAFNISTGTLDTSFNVQDDGDTPGCALRQGILYYGGHFNVSGAGCKPNALATCSTRHHVAAANVATNQLLTWNPGANSNHGVYTVSSGGGTVGFGGYFTKFGGKAQASYAAYSSTLP
jgi:hypothetical protein